MASGLEARQSIITGEEVATRDLTIRAKDTFNIVPRRHYLSRCNFRETKGRNTRKLGHMVMARKHQQWVGCYLWWLIWFASRGEGQKGHRSDHIQAWNNWGCWVSFLATFVSPSVQIIHLFIKILHYKQRSCIQSKITDFFISKNVLIMQSDKNIQYVNSFLILVKLEADIRRKCLLVFLLMSSGCSASLVVT